MRRIRAYTFELAWLFLLIGIFLFTPTRSSATAFDWIDLAQDCSSEQGWCVPVPIDIGFELF